MSEQVHDYEEDNKDDEMWQCAEQAQCQCYAGSLYKLNLLTQIESQQKKVRPFLLLLLLCMYYNRSVFRPGVVVYHCTSQPQRPQSTDNTKTTDRTSQFSLIPLLFLFVTFQTKPYFSIRSIFISLRISDTVVTKLPSTSSCHDRQSSALSLCYVLWKLHWFEPCTYCETHYR